MKKTLSIVCALLVLTVIGCAQQEMEQAVVQSPSDVFITKIIECLEFSETLLVKFLTHLLKPSAELSSMAFNKEQNRKINAQKEYTFLLKNIPSPPRY